MVLDFFKLLMFCKTKHGLKVYDDFILFIESLEDNPNQLIKIGIPEEILNEFMSQN